MGRYLVDESDFILNDISRSRNWPIFTTSGPEWQPPPSSHHLPVSSVQQVQALLQGNSRELRWIGRRSMKGPERRGLGSGMKATTTPYNPPLVTLILVPVDTFTNS
ncbi:unnamed protein product [Cyclocybe aegerita]|uniref:Uncharacterized protein n=1 Tax=Cyclocybe aegerita TaxID=1973307 RepID=A0A8S0W5H5_CYCAE|nr:unnamed protein product [Cyclocybe aegerita]